MTQPRRVETRGGGHEYRYGDAPIDGVTTVLNAMAKPALIRWAANQAAAYAVNEWDRLAPLPLTQRLDAIKNAPWQERDDAALRGKDIHKIVEVAVSGKEVAVPDHLLSPTMAAIRFMDDYDVTPLVVERPVFYGIGTAYPYGGTLDLIGMMRGNHTALIDFKTGKGIYPDDVSLQLAAYRFADFYLDDNDEARPMIPVGACYVVWIKPDSYEVFPIEAGPIQHRTFLYVQQIARHLRDAQTLLGNPLPLVEAS